MNLLTLALRNIKLNRKKYMMYVFSMGFSIFTVYTFMALMQNEYVLLAFRYDSRYRMVLTSFGIIILVFVLFFLISSNNSFIRARKKELSTYALFGMSNYRIGKLLFLETILVGAATLAVGIGAGIFFSKLMAMALLDLCLPAFVGDISFTIDPISILITALLFLGIFCLMGLSGLRVVYQFELVDLFKGDKMAEGKSKGSVPVLILSLLLIGAGYFLACNGNTMVVVLGAIPILVLVITGTYLFFWGGLPKVLYLIKNNKRVYYQGANLISSSSVSHRMRSVASVMATIAVLSAVAATAIATGFTLYGNAERNTYRVTGFDLAYWGEVSAVRDDIREILRDSNVKYEEETILLYETDPGIQTVSVNGLEFLTDQDTFRVYSESGFNRLAQASKTKLEAMEVSEGEACYIYAYSPENIESSILGMEMAFGEKTIRVRNVIRVTWADFGLVHSVILSDKDYESLTANGMIYPSADKGGAEAVLLLNYEGALSNDSIYGNLNSLLQDREGRLQTSYASYAEALATFGLISFIGFFMSGVFILMTASLLYFKQIMAAEEESHQYRMLRKIGMDEGTERQVIRKRLIPVFFIPLAIGIIHSVFAMKTADTVVFSNMIPVENSYLSVLGYSSIMYLAYAAVYCVFYFITKAQFGRIVRNQVSG